MELVSEVEDVQGRDPDIQAAMCKVQAIGDIQEPKRGRIHKRLEGRHRRLHNVHVPLPVHRAGCFLRK